jgi:tetratricopeptide (TPR) repeat protein
MHRSAASRTIWAVGVALAFCGVGASALAQPLAFARPFLLLAQKGEEAELRELLAQERRDADRARRQGDLRAARRILDEHLDDDPADAESRTLRALVRRQAGDWEGALQDAKAALEPPSAPGPELRAECVRNLADLLVELGKAGEAVRLLEAEAAVLDPQLDARDALSLGQARWAAGRRAEAREVLRKGAEGEEGSTWERLLARARCERRLGSLERATRTLVQAEQRPGERGESGQGEPEILSELAAVYFEADGEVDHPQAAGRSPKKLYEEALQRSPGQEAALLGMFELHRTNWKRQSRPAHEFLADLLAANPSSIGGLVYGARADLEDGDLLGARERLSKLDALAPARRDVRALGATLAWIEHRRDDARAALAQLATEDSTDAGPLVLLGETLNELYRFPEAVEFLREASERDPQDWRGWTQLGRALANTGDTRGGLAALEKAIQTAGGRADVWRDNTAMALRRMAARFTDLEVEGDLTFSWDPAAAEVLAAYQVPFYQEAREELAERYGFTPDPVHIQVFERFEDFSVRSTGFTGFPALGVCFGPVVTAVSPASQLRGGFSWARTSFHEFTHVVHLGLSHNRCPRWITEGLATWEEEQRNPAWTRNMRRDLVDALANGDLIPVRDLNRAFRGPRILFGYYQGGLLCELLIERDGFPAILKLLEAFDRGLDIDQALGQVYGQTPEELDRDFEAFVRQEVGALAIEPRWSPTSLARARLGLSADPPADAEDRKRWSETWCTIAWGRWQQGARVDAEQALRRAASAGELPPRARFLQGELKLASGDGEGARAEYEAGLAAGGRDFRARMALGQLALKAGDQEQAAEHFAAAEELFPGYAEKPLAAELLLAEVLGQLGRNDEQQRARERWLAWNSDEYPLRIELARWHAAAGRPAEAERWFREANEIDPFRRALHAEWGAVLEALGRPQEALREYEVALLVPADLELDKEAGPPDGAERARLLTAQARVLVALGRGSEAREVAVRALDLDPTSEEARAIAGSP